MSELFEKIIIDHEGRIITKTDAFSLDSDIEYIRSDIVEKMLAEQREKDARLAEKVLLNKYPGRTIRDVILQQEKSDE